MLNKLVLAAATVAVAFSASADFIPTTGTQTYTTAANWDSGNINGVFSRTQTGSYTILFPADTTLTTGLTFNQAMATFAATLRGDGGNRTLTLGGDISVNVTGNAVRSVGIGGGSNANLNINPGGNRTFNVTRAGDLLSITNTLVGGSGDITKTGAGTLILSNNSHDAGDIYVNEGILQAQAVVSGPTKKVYLGATSGSASATLRVTGILTNGVEVRAGSTGDVVYRSNANNDSGISGAIKLDRELTVSLLSGSASPNSRGLQLTGAISGSGGLVVTGGGTTNPGSLTLSGAAGNTYTGTTRIVDGILNLNKSSGNAVGNTIIGDGIVDGVNDALVLLAANQIADSAALNIANTASLELGGFSDLVAATFVDLGGQIATGTGGTLFTSALTINGVSIPNGIYTASSPSLGGINFGDYIRGTGSVVVPEPASLSLLGLVGLASLRRRK
jgi:autotransporter-associated beta strand protein